MIPGILILNNKNKYGFKKNKEIFMFQPLSKKYPCLKIASFIKRNLIKKGKKVINQYVIVDNEKKHLVQIIGDINNEYNQYEIYLHYYQLVIPKIKLDKFKITYSHRDITHLNIYSIDPPNCQDIDDAISYENNIIGVHIADVSYILDQIGFNPQYYSSIYLPHKQINMLPEELVNICSLLPKQKRATITIWITYDNNKIDYKFERTLIQSKGAYTYDQAKNIISPYFYNLVKLIGEKEYNYIIHDTHGMIEVLMILVNNIIAQYLFQTPGMVFRIHKTTLSTLPENPELAKFVKILQSKAAIYSFVPEGHKGLGLKYYTHFTSPIRRYVDIYIHRLLYGKLNQPIDLQDINETNHRIKKLERKINEIKLLHQITSKLCCSANLLNFDEKYLSLYLPTFKILYSYKIIDKRLNNITQIEINHDNIIITINEKNIKFTIYEELDITLNVINNKLYVEIDKFNFLYTKNPL